MKFMTILLKEGRKEDLKKKYSNKFDEETLDWILNISDLEDFNHKYTDFVLRDMNPEYEYDTEYVEMVIELLKLFDKYQSHLEKKDISQYKNLIELESALHPVVAKQKEKENEGKVNKIYEDDKFTVIEPLTKESSCKYGSNTKWCTAAKKDNRFEAYTSGSQGLYYILSKRDLENNLYKIAIHFKDNNDTFYDASDDVMNNREKTLFKTAFPEMWKAIKDYQDEHYSYMHVKIMEDAFKTEQRFEHIIQVPLDGNSYKQFKLELVGFDTFLVENRVYHVDGEYNIFDVGANKLLDSYVILLRCKLSKDSDALWVDVSFSALDEGIVHDFGLENASFQFPVRLTDSAKVIQASVANQIFSEVRVIFNKNNSFEKYVHGDSAVWRPDRIGYGYTFAKNKGLIKKLVGWLDKGTVGTKLDFLTDIGKLDKKLENGKAYYSHKDKNSFLPSSNWRGHFASFFASAKHAGILSYRKIGNQYLLRKGPNFDAFKRGELKAL